MKFEITARIIDDEGRVEWSAQNCWNKQSWLDNTFIQDLMLGIMRKLVDAGYENAVDQGAEQGLVDHMKGIAK